jgi:hypothetical protein
VKISEYEAERWRQLSDELLGQVARLKAMNPTSKAEWQVIEAVETAHRHLFSAFGAVMREKSSQTS